MISGQTVRHATALDSRPQRALALLYTLGLSALATIEPMMAATFETFNPVRQGALLTLLIFMMLLLRPWLLLTRELGLYTAFTAYMFVTLIWAPSATIGMNTLLPAVDFILLLLLFGSLVAFHDLRGVLMGALGGFLLGALVYTRATGFPFVYPPEFSYNAIAGMYLLGLFMTLVFAWYTRWRIIPLLIALVILVLIAATTSIKTNLGIALGAGAAALFYSKSFLRIFWRNILLLSILGAALVFAIISNPKVLERVQFGLDRVSRGVQVLQRREDAARDTSYGDRADWKNQGIKGWARSPLFGNGVEAFRTDVGITSHSTPIDLLYNTGVIGVATFYGIFFSIALRLRDARRSNLRSLPPLIFAGLVCYAFITLSGTMHYNSFMAIFFAISGGLLLSGPPRPVGVPKPTVESPS
jgi:hypothetical protein